MLPSLSSARVTRAFVLPAHTGRQSPPLSWQLLPRLAGTGGPGDTTGAEEEEPRFSCSTFSTRQVRAVHTHTHTHLCFSASRSKPRPLAPRFISQASRQCTASGLEREQRAVTQEEVWALRREASGEKHRTEGEKRDQRSGVAAAGADEMGTLGSRRSEGAPRVQSGQIWPGV